MSDMDRQHEEEQRDSSPVNNSPPRRAESRDRRERDEPRGPPADNNSPPKRGDSRERRGRDEPRERRDRDGPRSGDNGDTVSLIVRNISFRVFQDEIHRMFSYYGRVKDVYIPKDYNTKRPKGFAFVEFLDRRDAEEAIYRLDGIDLDGRRISVSEAKDRRKTPEELRARVSDRPDDRGRGGRRSRSRDRDFRGNARREGGGNRDHQRGRREERSRSRDRRERSSTPPNAFDDRRKRSRSREQEEENEN